MKETRLLAIRNSFWIALVYVGLGMFTPLVFEKLPDVVQYLASVVMLATFPVFFISFPVWWDGGNMYYLIIPGLISLFLGWYIACRSLLNHYKRKELLSDHEFIKETFGRSEFSMLDLSGSLRWIYSFSGRDEHKLVEFHKLLAGVGYELLNLIQDETGLWKMTLAKNEVLTPGKLAHRNQNLEVLADKNKLGSYDGWEVVEVK